MGTQQPKSMYEGGRGAAGGMRAHVTMGSRLLSFRMCDGASISAATRRGFAGRGVLQL